MTRVVSEITTSSANEIDVEVDHKQNGPSCASLQCNGNISKIHFMCYMQRESFEGAGVALQGVARCNVCGNGKNYMVKSFCIYTMVLKICY